VNKTEAKQKLIRILQNAHAGELAAAYAYRGHWKSVRNTEQKASIKKIEQEEWDHRMRVLGWLDNLGAKPRKMREKIFWTIGRLLGVLCFVSGWFFPMYFAGRLESQNTQEYKDAAAFAEELGVIDCVNDMMFMSTKELEHEEYFRSVVKGHWLLPPARLVFRWS
jgi:demethoxyubiquinone hydroxylase (CLK1/Coq7/Cat5 family)